MKIKLVLLLFVLLFFFSSSALPVFPITFDHLDADSDGYISLSEAKPRPDIMGSWKSIDKDKDGLMDIMEYAAYEGKDRFQPPEEIGMPELGAAQF